jgi:DNA-binding MarR family transcriptional regulator
LPEEETFIAILRTSGHLSARLTRLFKAHGLTSAQYNILRILRGAGESLPCLEVGHRLISPEPDITRLVDRLEKAALVGRHRSTRDRRVVEVSITRAGLNLLGRLDAPVAQVHKSNLGHLSRNDLATINRLLSQVLKSVAA